MSCRNCGAAVTTEFCGSCGQRTLHPDPTLKEFLHELAEELLHWDGKLAATFRLLLVRPGALTDEYLAGRRIRYISPLRVYLTCSVLFFFVGALVPKPATSGRGAEVRSRIGPITIADDDTVQTIAQLDTLAKHGRWVGRVWGAHLTKAMRKRGELRRALTAAVPKTMFVMVPLFAALVALVLRSRRRRYPQHLAFALHVHAFMYLALTAALAGRLTTSALLQGLIRVPIFVLIALYFVAALRRVYGGSRHAATLRAAAISLIYLVVFLTAMVGTFGIVVLLQF